MSSRQKHRGQHASDADLFSGKWLPVLNAAVADFSYLLSRGYADGKATLKLIGDRYRLNSRQRKALMRAVCSDEAARERPQKQVPPEALAGANLAIDGYNLLITVESGLAGGIILACRDSTYRDIASIHGTYRRVEETLPALQLIGQQLQALQVAAVHWYLDAPVSNSGRLKGIMYEVAQQHDFPWEVQLVNNPDRTLAQLQGPICVSADSWVIDAVPRWFNLHRYLVDQLPHAAVIELRG